MGVPKVKKAKRPQLSAPKTEPLNRKCRSCTRWGTTRSSRCPWCGAEYGRLELGLDLPKDVAPAVDEKGFPIKEAEL